MDEQGPIAGKRVRRTAPDGRVVPDDLDDTRITSVVEQFYARAREDDLLGPVFIAAIPDAVWAAHMVIIADFWSSMLLGTGRYNGRPMPKHLALPGITDAHFVRWLQLFRKTAEELCSQEAAALFVDRSERIAHSFRLAMAFQRGEDTTSVARLEPWGPLSA